MYYQPVDSTAADLAQDQVFLQLIHDRQKWESCLTKVSMILHVENMFAQSELDRARMVKDKICSKITGIENRLRQHERYRRIADLEKIEKELFQEIE